MLDKVTRIAWLYDFYGPLLTEKQRRLIELYYHQDFSLGEIAELTNVSRQAVHDLLRRAKNSLEDYEKALGFLKKYLKRLEIIQEIDLLLNSASLEQELSAQMKGLLEALGEIN